MNAPPSASADQSLTLQKVRLMEEWDAVFRALWSEKLSAALEAAGRLYAPDAVSPPRAAQMEEWVPAFCWQTLNRRTPNCPDTAEVRYRAVLLTVGLVLKAIREAKVLTPEEWPYRIACLEIALRPIRRLQLGALTHEVCLALGDFHAGRLQLQLSKPERYSLEMALGRTLAALPPNELRPFWEALHSDNPLMRGAIRLGLKHLTAAHAVPHLLHGLEAARDHATRTAIVDCLEQIADPRAIAPLTRFKQEAARDDWPLARHIGRVLRVIEYQSRNDPHRHLLRPVTTPPDQANSLLRPATDRPDDLRRRAAEAGLLLRPTAREPDDLL